MAAACALLAWLWLVRGRSPREVGVPGGESADAGPTAEGLRSAPRELAETREEAASVDPRPGTPPAAAGDGESPGGAIRGRVLFPDGTLPDSEALARSRVSLDFVTREVGPDGSFEFTELEPDSYPLDLFVPGFEPIGREVRVEAGRTSELELVLGRGIAVSGRVVDELGAPLAGADVSVASEGEDGQGWRSISLGAAVDEQGRFSIQGVPGGRVEVRARCDGRMKATVELGPLTAGDERTDVVIVLGPGNALGGSVLAAGLGPGAGAKLLIFGEQDGEERQTVADGVGRFRVRGLGSGPFRVWAWDVEDDGGLRALTSIADVPAGSLDLELRLARPGSVELTLHGRKRKGLPRINVLDLRGWPAEVRPDPFNAGWRPGTRMRSVDGGLLLEDLEPGERWIVATEAGGEFRSGRARILVREGETSRDEIVLGPACRLSVTLVQDGEPVLGSIAIRAEDGFVMRLGLGVDAEGAQEPRRSAWLPCGRYHLTGEREGLRAEAEVTLSDPFRELSLELE